MRKQRFVVNQLVRKGKYLCEVRYYEPKNRKYLIIPIEPVFAWYAMWIEGNRLSPLF